MAPKNQEDEKPIKIDKWDGAACKNTLDDAAKKIMTENCGYVESNSLVDGRLAICTLSVLFALFALLWDFLNPFPQSRPVLIICVVSYFVLMGVLTWYTTYFEQGIFLVALQKDKAGIDPDSVWQVSSGLKRYDDEYKLHIRYTDGITKQVRETEKAWSVANFFDENGVLCDDLFEPEVLKMHSSLCTEKKQK